LQKLSNNYFYGYTNAGNEDGYKLQQKSKTSMVRQIFAITAGTERRKINV
jgi:hypothetical protein